MRNSQVKKLGTDFLLLLLAMQAVVVFAQTPEEWEAGFTLSLSMGRHSGEFSKATLVMVVTLINVGDGWIGESTCSAFGALYKLNVVYNGVPLKEPDARRRHREDMEAGEEGTGCSGSNPGGRIWRGEFMEDRMYYDTNKPGTYEFTVERRAFSDPPGKKVAVRSNKLTVVVPPPRSISTGQIPDAEKSSTIKERTPFGAPLADKSSSGTPNSSLTVLQFLPRGSMRNDQELFVTETNLSKGVIREAGCFPLDFPPAIGIAVIHDGIPMQMDERRWAAKYYRAAKKGPALCDEISWEQKAQPGGAIGNPLDLSNFYDLSKPGKYEVTLTKEPFSSDSPINVAVRSNTVTINVPEPKAQKLNY